MRLENMTWEEAREAASGGIPVLLPSGAITQYGPHLPLGANSIIAHELALRVAEEVEVVVAPPHWYGYAYPTEDLPGNITVPPDVLCDYIHQILHSLARQEFRKFLLFYGQLPNITSLNYAAQRLYLEYQDSQIAVVAWWQLAKQALRKHFGDEPGYHAESSETSLLLALRPELVREDKIADEMPAVSLGYDYYPRPSATLTPSGVRGKPSLSSREKGAALTEEIVANLADMLEHDLIFESAWELMGQNE